jgi:hypothetical protein
LDGRGNRLETGLQDGVLTTPPALWLVRSLASRRTETPKTAVSVFAYEPDVCPLAYGRLLLAAGSCGSEININ